MSFPFRQESLSEEESNDKTHKRANKENTTCKGSIIDLSISHVSDTPENNSVVNSEEISSWEETPKKGRDKTVSFVNKHLPRKRKRNRKKRRENRAFLKPYLIDY